MPTSPDRKVKLGRRTLLKAAGLGAIAVSLPAAKPLLLGTSAEQVEELLRKSGIEYRVARNACFICGQRCPLKIFVTDGGRVIRFVAFNSYGDESEYAVCGRPQTLFEAKFVKERPPGPLERVGERGQGKYRQITWDEALDKLANILKSYQPEEIIVFAHQGPDVGIMKKFLGGVVGIPNITKHCDTCHTGMDSGAWWVFGKQIGPGGFRPDYKYARLVVFMGRNPVEGIVSSPWTKMFSEGRRRGMKIITFDVRESRLTALSDHYYIIPPGTDLAIELALLHVMLRDGLYDRDYVARYTNAPMLVRTDTMEPLGLYDNPQMEGKKTYAVMDEADGKVKPKTEAKSPVLMWEGEVDGVPVKTVLRLLWDAVEKYTPKWAEKITGVPAEEIEWLARDLYSYAPQAFIDHGYKGTRYLNEGMMFRVRFIIDALLGAFGAKGGIAWPRKPKIKNPLDLLGIKGQGAQGEPLYKYWEKQGYKLIHKKCYSMLAIKSILEEKPHPYKVAIIINQNLVGHVQGSADVIKALEKLDHVIVMDNTLNETTLYADLVLPLTMFFEETSPTLNSVAKTGRSQIFVVEKAVDPPPGVDARPGWWVVAELGKRLDPANAGKYEKLADAESIWRMQAEKLGIDYNTLAKHGVYMVYDQPLYHPLKGKGHANVTGEIELISVKGLQEHRAMLGRKSLLNPLPIWIEPAWMTAKSNLGEDEFVAVDIFHRMTATNMWVRFSRLVNDSLAWDRLDGVVINEERARRLGIRDGDLVRIVGPGGTLKARVRLSRGIHPTVVLAPHGTNAGPADKEVEIETPGGLLKTRLFSQGGGLGINTNMLMKLEDMLPEEGGRSMQCDVIVRIERLTG